MQKQKKALLPIYDMDGRLGLYGPVETVFEKMNMWHERLDVAESEMRTKNLYLAKLRQELSDTMTLRAGKDIWVEIDMKLYDTIVENEKNLDYL